MDKAIFDMLKKATRSHTPFALRSLFLEQMPPLFPSVRFYFFTVRQHRSGSGKSQIYYIYDNSNNKLKKMRIEKHKAPLVYKSLSLGRELIETNQKTQQVEIWYPVNNNDRLIYLLGTTSPECNTTPLSTIYELIEIFTNILLLIDQRYRDPMTGLYNRYAFHDIIRPILIPTDTDQPQEQEHCLAMLDIDHFKKINDTYGHMIGDEVLILFSRQIANMIRSDDAFFRMGGEEFITIIRNTSQEKSFETLERIRNLISESRFPRVGQITVSIGSAMFTQKSDPSAAIDRADKALYYAKSNGRNQTRNYETLLKEKKVTPASEENTIDIW